MSAQQIKLNINDLVNRIEDEDKLKACYLVLATIANERKKQPQPKAAKSRVSKKHDATANLKVDVDNAFIQHQETIQLHDLSLVFLANDLFKGSQPLPESAIIAFDDALKSSALKIPTLPNRL